MRRGPFVGIWWVLLTISFSSCEQRVPALFEPAPDAAVNQTGCDPYRVFSEVAATATGRVVGPDEVRFADGQLAFLRGLRSDQVGLDARFAITTDCRLISLESANEWFSAAHQQQWGRIPIEFAWGVEHSGSSGPFSCVAFIQGSPFDPEPLLGFARERAVDVTLLSSPPAISFRASKEYAIEISRQAGIFTMIVETGGEAGKGSVSYASSYFSDVTRWWPSNVLTSHSNLLNANGQTAQNVRVGIQENRDGCAIDDGHEAFDYLTGNRTNYEHAPLSCNVDCDTACTVGSGSNPILNGTDCVSGICVDRHSTGVSSRIASGQRKAADDQPQGPFHAAGVEFFVSGTNRNDPLLDYLPTIENYKWFRSQDVFIVNESIGPPDTGSTGTYRGWSVSSDLAARNWGLTIVRTSGNRPQNSSAPLLKEADCFGFNSICVGAAYFPDPLDVQQAFWASISRWKNPAWQNGAEKKELEKPDLLAEGVNAHVAISTTGNRWYSSPGEVRQDGTSFAAPVVTGLVALLNGQCGRGSPMSPLYYRSVLRTVGTWTPTRVESLLPSVGGYTPTDCGGLVSPPPLYPATHLGCDHYGGAGVVTADFLDERACPGAQRECEATQADPCVANGSGTLTDMSRYPDWVETDEKSWVDNSTRPRSLRQSGGGFSHLYSFPQDVGRRGMRVRMTYSYFSCPVPFGSAATLAPANNLDLILYGVPAGSSQAEVIYAAQALHETNEGFDVTLLKDYDSIEAGLLGPQSLAGCVDADGHPTTGEPFWWWAMWGKT